MTNQKIVTRFAENYYPTIHKLYYETLWNALSIQQRKDILEQDFIVGRDDKDHFIKPENALVEKDLIKLREVL